MKENYKIWQEALESNKYIVKEQKELKIKTDTGFSFSKEGVACELYQKIIKDKKLKIKLINNIFSFDGEIENLPDKVIKWLNKEESTFWSSINKNFWNTYFAKLYYGPYTKDNLNPWKIGEPASLFEKII